MREVTLHFGAHNVLILKNCLYVPNIRRNLISVSCLACNRFFTLFNKNFISIKYGVDEIYSRMLTDNLYLIEPNTPLCINSHKSNHKRKESSSINQTHLWHLRLGHINLDRIHRLVRVDTSVH